MAKRFQVDLKAYSTMQRNCEATPRLDPSQSAHASQFADEVRKLLGDDSEPDPLFFEDSWSIGVPAALENWCQRQQSQVARECESRVLQQLDNLGNIVFVQGSEWNMEHFLAAHAEVIASCHDAFGPRWSHEESAARSGNRRTRGQATFVEECDRSQATINPMTELVACRLLGVAATSTREHVRTAYRRLVGKWHPDRLEGASREVHRRANEQMAAINEAYRLLRSGLLKEFRSAHSA